MKKFIVVLGILIAIVVVALIGLRIYTKSFSPQEIASYNESSVSLTVAYSRPFKNDREIFGELVPYGEVWRTGANEATVFKTNTPLRVGGEVLPAGEYSLFTIPGEDQWDIIFNSETGQWGVIPLDGQANRDPENDVLVLTVPSIHSSKTYDQFTITFDDMSEEIEMIMMWDKTMVVVPFTVADTQGSMK